VWSRLATPRARRERRASLGTRRGLESWAGFAFLPLLALAIFHTGCSEGWRKDMWDQQAHRSQSAPRPEPPRSVPLGAAAHLADRDQADSLRNPIPADSASIRHGRFLFVQRCGPCHGAEGRGGGPVSKFFPPAPDLAYQTVRARSDGFLFGTITFGGRAMPPQPEGLTERDRWDLVAAIRDIQRAAPVTPP
jgi:S-disulfanyl-L-cysteine oxidoreductase SoxD